MQRSQRSRSTGRTPEAQRRVRPPRLKISAVSSAASGLATARTERPVARLKVGDSLKVGDTVATTVRSGTGARRPRASRSQAIRLVNATAQDHELPAAAGGGPSAGRLSTRVPTPPKSPAEPVRTARSPAASGGDAPDGTMVTEVEIRPSGTIVSRRRPERRRAILHLPNHPPVSGRPPAWMLESCHVAPARAGDQGEILQLLGGLPSPPSRGEFHAAVDHPDYDPANRLVARLGGRIVGHAEIVPRSLGLGMTSAPGGDAAAGDEPRSGVRGAVLERVAVLPECRGAGHGQRLVQAAEERMRQSGTVVAFTRTRIASSYHELGWSVLGRDCATPGRPTEILARLLEGPAWAGEQVTMRQWRHVELPAILRIYRQNAARYVGPCDRDENYGRWLVSRGAFDSILVALVGQDRYELHESSARIVGYCVQAGSRVLEIAADQQFAGLERAILARVCAEAIENDRQEIVYESSVADPLHAAVAGGEGIAPGGDRMIVARVFRPLDLLQSLAPTVAARVAAAGVRETVELGLDTPGFRGSIVVPERRGSAAPQATVQPGRLGRSYLRLAEAELARLLLGQCDPAEAVAAGRMEPSTQIALRLAAQLFPRQPLWCPMWDDLPA
jgi:GNAT superfamily N-acetyltransferase